MNDLSPETNPPGKYKAELPDADNPNLDAEEPENGDALVEFIESGIDAARERQTDVTEHTARAIARAIANALGDNGLTLGEFARTGAVSYTALSNEFLEVYNDPTTPAQVRTWIDWLGTYLVQANQEGSGWRFMINDAAPQLNRLLVATRISLGCTVSTVHIPASKTLEEVNALTRHLNALPTVGTTPFQVFLTLPDVDASANNVTDSFQDNYVGNFVSIEDALYGLVELEEWETDLHNFAAVRGILTKAVSIDHDMVEAQTREMYDLVEREGVIYAFNK
ncbi:hypothetical protein [Glaciihabitans sp. UYNi722]|uniref:hypothetical protein n=1 Tax=Glaciihabitans sp. UYNi722 TaxID=3156344 RepID=UPI0033997929